MAKKEPRISWSERLGTWFMVVRNVVGALFSVLIFLFFFSFLFSLLGGVEPSIPSGNIVVIPISGAITTSGSAFSGEVDSEKMVSLLKKANASSSVKAIILEINSPGGSPVATDEIAAFVKKINKPVVSVIREVGASGAFWIATAADRVFANRMSVTGSIGVTSSHLEFGGLLSDYNITYRRLVSGKYKDTGSPFREMTADEIKLYQALLGKINDEFVSALASNRDLSLEFVKKHNDGFVFLGSDAKEFGFVDELGGRDDAVEYLAKNYGIVPEVGVVKFGSGLFGSFSASFSDAAFALGRGLGQSLSGLKV